MDRNLLLADDKHVLANILADALEVPRDGVRLHAVFNFMHTRLFY